MSMSVGDWQSLGIDNMNMDFLKVQSCKIIVCVVRCNAVRCNICIPSTTYTPSSSRVLDVRGKIRKRLVRVSAQNNSPIGIKLSR